MSELIQKNDDRITIHWKLLTGASALVLTAYISSADVANAEDASRPTIWIEVGADMNHINGQGPAFVPDFLSAYPTSTVLWHGVTPVEAQKPPLFNFGEEAKISFQPDGSDWVFSAGVHIGRSSSKRRVHHQTTGIHYTKYASGVPVSQASAGKFNFFTHEKFATTTAARKDSYTLLDFTAGKDVGLGLFGRDGSSVLSGGVRIAQFASHSSVQMRARPDLSFKYYPSASNPNRINLGPNFHSYYITGHAERSFRGIGPSLSWSASAPFAGNLQNGEISVDWGANVSVLFGKQKTRVRHHEGGYYQSAIRILEGYDVPGTVYQNNPPAQDRSRSVTVPNVGGSIGLSYRYAGAKLSIGYRADFFFGAMDTGIDKAKKSNLTFNGPYASISIGLGD
jgi:iron complex outermembrane recepter protein